MAYRVSTVPLSITNLEAKIAAIWEGTCEKPVQNEAQLSAIYACKSVAEFWAVIMKEELRNSKKDDGFEEFCNAVLISSLACEKLRTARTYFFEDAKEAQKGPPPAANHSRRRLFAAATTKLESVDWSKLTFSLADLWDGRMILGIYRKVITKAEILPFRLQDEFSKLHQLVGLKMAVPTDTNDKLLDPLSTPEKKAQKLHIDELKLCKTDNKLLNEFMPEAQELISAHESQEDSNETLKHMLAQFPKWNFIQTPDKLIELEKFRLEEEKKMNSWRLGRNRINLSRWYQNFADSLEGRGNDLLVDFARTPRLPTVAKSEKQSEEVSTEKPANGVHKKAGGGGKQGAGGGKKGAKAGKEPVLSKKDQILKANRDSIIKKQVESDKTKIAFATQVKAQTIPALDDVFRKLELHESKALCIFEKVIRLADLFAEKIPTFKTLEQKRDSALDLVETLKTCTTKFIQHLDDVQKEKVNNLWISLGFVKSAKKIRAVDKSFELGMNLVDYQLYHGGRLIDILSDPQKDDRVTGFSPDGWQRKMLDVVDQDKSALIVAPTSAGKTFVSYYCIEKVLRKNNDDVVVYVSPSKPLMNQVVGSVYARFRNKPMSGGKILHGSLTLEYSDNCLNCQVLVTIPECLEIMLLSTDPVVQQFVSRIRYVIVDEVHCINSGNQPGHIWEHIFLLIRCPFLALSATVSNVDMVRSWLQSAETIKAVKGETPREVALITYDERWSELELSIARMKDGSKDAHSYVDELEIFNRGGSVAAQRSESNSPTDENDDGESARADTPTQEIQSQDSRIQLANDLILSFHPYGVYKPEKLKMFGIPVDQRLTARQVVELYSIMSEIDSKVKDEFEPSKYFGYSIGTENFSWLTRKGLRDYETNLKDRFLEWLKNDVEKIKKVFALLDSNVHEEFEKRSKPFNMRVAALHNIVPLLDDLKRNDRLPAICFNDDRDICEWLAIRLFTEMESREFAHLASDDFKRRFNFKAEDKAAKLAKRKRDAEKKKKTKSKKKGDDREDDNAADDARDWDDGADAGDQFFLQKIRLEEELRKFKFYGRWSDEDLYNNTLQRLLEKSNGRPSTARLARLIKRGIGFHHDGLSSKERGTVEILFRAGFLGIVFSTSTLALGMNMPCKTVIFGIDTPMLTPLQYRQMSGRAGRRGFDSSGTVVFMSLPTSKIRRLLTSSLATLRGNVPFTTSFLLKLFGYVKGSAKSAFNNEEIAIAATDALAAIAEAPTRKKLTAIETTDVTTSTIRRIAALSLLRTPLVLHTRHESHFKALERLLKYLIFFNVQVLRKYNFLNEKCELTGFAYLATHLSNFEPGNLVFSVLLQSGVLHQLERKFEDSEDSQFRDTLVNILANIFTKKFLPLYSYGDESEVPGDAPILKPMPTEVEEVIKEYNENADKLLLACLQLASPTRRLQSSVLQLSGKCDAFEVSNMNIVSTLDEDLVFDASFVPTVRLQFKDHRGRKIYRNSYAYDFWKRGDSKSLVDYNKLSISEIWYLINGFSRVLSGIKAAFASMAKPTDPLKLAIDKISKEYEFKFKKAFGMVIKDDEKVESDQSKN